jgi:hypothetical protein
MLTEDDEQGVVQANGPRVEWQRGCYNAKERTRESGIRPAPALLFVMRPRTDRGSGRPLGHRPARRRTVSRPADVLDLKNWKLTLPIKPDKDVKTKKNGNTYEVLQPELAEFQDKNCFFVNDEGKGVVLTVHHGDLTTGNSGNPRCELREMKNNGTKTFDWDSRSGTHTLVVEGQVNRLTKTTKTVVLAQVHNDPEGGGGDDLTVFRLEGDTLYVTDPHKGHDENHAYTVTKNFKLNTRYTLKIEVKNGKARYWYNGNPVEHASVTVKDPTAYFKAGNYLQSNKKSAKHESTDEHSEVILYSVKVTHSQDD